MIDLSGLEVWFVTGSQHLYGPETLAAVAGHAARIASHFSRAAAIPVSIRHQPVMTTPETIRELCLEATGARQCIGVIAWMHTFSPAKMWIAGLKALQKPLLHLHTQFNRDLPWPAIDMDFMNLNQSAHGDREFGFGTARLGLARKVVVGYWEDEDVAADLGTWTRAAAAWHDAQQMKVARFGDNMRGVAVTEGDKVEAQIRLGYSVAGFGVGDLAARVREVSDAEVNTLVAEYGDAYRLAPALAAGGSGRASLQEAARIELGLRHFLTDGGFTAFTDSFEDLHGLPQLPGLPVQRLMAEGLGFGAEGDWKTAALVRSMKVMSAGLEGGTSFMEDYTYHWRGGGQVLGAHMLEICPSIAAAKPSAEIHPLSIGGKGDPVRLVFDARTGPAVTATIIDLGNRFRIVVNEVTAVPPEQPLPKLPVARAIWKPHPDLKTAATTWILAGGAHHTGFSLALTTAHLEDFAQMAGIEALVIDRDTTVRRFQDQLRWNSAYYRMHSGL